MDIIDRVCTDRETSAYRSTNLERRAQRNKTAVGDLARYLHPKTRPRGTVSCTTSRISPMPVQPSYQKEKDENFVECLAEDTGVRRTPERTNNQVGGIVRKSHMLRNKEVVVEGERKVVLVRVMSSAERLGWSCGHRS